MDVQIRETKWQWLGHTLRKDPGNTTRQASDWNLEGIRKTDPEKELTKTS